MYKSYLKYLFLFILSVFLLSSCRLMQSSGKQLYDPVEVAQLSKKLNIPLSNMNEDDDRNMRLYAECSQWISTRYRYAGMTKSGVDCSGLIYNVFKSTYNKKVPRSTDQLSRKVKNISKGDLCAGDLVFFATSKSKSKITHVGIYLKDGSFIHSSSSSGVIVSRLSEKYYKSTWVKAGRL